MNVTSLLTVASSPLPAFSLRRQYAICFGFTDVWGVWGVQIEIAPSTPGGSILWDRRDHWFSFDTHFSLMAPRPFLSHTLVTASAGREDLVRGWYVLMTSSRSFGDEREVCVCVGGGLSLIHI